MGIKEVKFKQNIIFFFLIIIYTFIDYISKFFIFRNLSIAQQVILTDFFNLTLVVNKGISFGFLNTLNRGRTILSLIVSAIIILLICLLINEKKKFVKFSYGLIISGALGNTIDRIIYGGVIDFLDFHYQEYHFPAFNIADSLIFTGCFLLVFGDILFRKLNLTEARH